MEINTRLLPIKAHYFFFMAAMGPILPQLTVYGKQLGIPAMVMGSVTGILPILFLLAKPLFGFLVDRYRQHRKHIFIALVFAMGVFYAGLYFVPTPMEYYQHLEDNHSLQLDSCNVTDPAIMSCQKLNCEVSYNEENKTDMFLAVPKSSQAEEICLLSNDNHSTAFNSSLLLSSCDVNCFPVEDEVECMFTSVKFWTFVLLMSAGTIGFNVINSVSDAICFDLLGEGEQMSYGKQRVWGTIGFGLSALISGYFVDSWSTGDVKSIAPALVVMVAFLLVDILCCRKLKLPVMESPKNIIADIMDLLKFTHIRIFIIFAALAGIVDSFIIYFFFWYLEELAAETDYLHHIKLLEGIVVAAETLGGEVLFFSVSGSILRAIGYGHSLTMCFICYALRLGLISAIPSPWWVVPVELFLQGPTYAMCYTTIVAYASAVSPPGASATMQGLVAGIDDGFGYAVGSVLGGILYRTIGGRGSLQVFSGIALVCAVLHFSLYRTILKDFIPSTTDSGDEQTHSAIYLPPDEAIKTTDHHIGEKRNCQTSYDTIE